ncbi:TPA: M14 family metallocarboxypeptidase [Salmonella enterica]|uniref:M14 family metallocarboxypeptidase n=1 Tax=Salmonella enterica TaxID=28901 RepID=A0A757C4B4_SALER|nr:M14 family metallocarboxypeptidase [Salmonella enterica]
MIKQYAYPIGKPGQPWAEPELQQWRKCQTRFRSYQNDVLDALEIIRSVYDVIQYGELNYDGEIYPLMAVKSKVWDDTLPVVLITGGVSEWKPEKVLFLLLPAPA